MVNMVNFMFCLYFLIFHHDLKKKNHLERITHVRVLQMDHGGLVIAAVPIHIRA